MPIDVYDFYNGDPKSQSASNQAANAPSDNTFDVMDFAGGNTAPQTNPQSAPQSQVQGQRKFSLQTASNQSLSDLDPDVKNIFNAKDIGAGVLKPYYNAELGLTQLGIQGAGKLGLLNPQQQSNYEGALQKIYQIEQQKYPTGTPSDVIGQTIGYMLPGGRVGKALGGALPAAASETIAAPTLGGALARIGLSTATGGAIAGTGYVDPDSGISRGAQTVLGALAAGAGQAAGEGISGAINVLKAPEYQKLGSNINKLISKRDEILNNIADAQTNQETGATIKGRMENLEDQLHDNYTSFYKQLETAVGKDKVLSDDEIAKAYFNNQKAFTDKVPGAIQNELNKYTLFNANPAQTQPKDLTVGDAIDLVKMVNARLRATKDGGEYKALANVRDSIYDAMDKVGANSDAANLFMQARNARVAYNNVFEQKNIIQDLVDKKSQSTALVAPEQVMGKILQGRPIQNISLIKNTLLGDVDKDGNIKPESAAAWSTLQRAGLEQSLFKGIVDKKDNFLPMQFVKNYDKTPPEVRDLLVPPELKGQVNLMYAASKHNLQSSNTLYNKVRNLLTEHWKKIMAVGAVGGGLHHLFSGEETPKPQTSNQDQDSNQ